MIAVAAPPAPEAVGTPIRTPLGLFAAAVAFLLPVVFSPSTNSTFWAPKNALLPLVAAVGLPCLAHLVQRESKVRGPARAAAAFLLVAFVSAALAHNRTTSVFGVYGAGTGLLFVAALVGAWAIGASLDEHARRDLRLALLAGIVLNGVVALIATVADLSSLGLHYDARAMGLQGNPVHLAAIAAGGLALAADRFEHRLRFSLLLVALLAASIEVSGTRAGLVSGAAVLAWSCRRLGRRRAAGLLLAALLGFGVGGLLARLDGASSVSDRLGANGGGGVSARLDLWWASRHAVAERPAIGIGPGGFRQATSGDLPVRVARSFGTDSYFADAHNLVVEYAVTTGLIGLAALSLWLVLALAGTEGALCVAALAVLAVGLVEPQWPGTTPLALLALGAAGKVPDHGRRRAGVGIVRGTLVAGRSADRRVPARRGVPPRPGPPRFRRSPRRGVPPASPALARAGSHTEPHRDVRRPHRARPGALRGRRGLVGGSGATRSR